MGEVIRIVLSIQSGRGVLVGDGINVGVDVAVGVIVCVGDATVEDAKVGIILIVGDDFGSRGGGDKGTAVLVGVFVAKAILGGSGLNQIVNKIVSRVKSAKATPSKSAG
jgi:hypothetical protein